MIIKNREPILFLSKKLWKFATRERPLICLYATLSTLATLAMLSGPLLFGFIIKEVQWHGINEENLPFVFLLLALLFSKDLVFWILHGPARVIERVVAFRIALRYRQYL